MHVHGRSAPTRRTRVVLSFLVALAVTVVLVPAGSSRVAVPPKVYPTLSFVYTNDCTFTMQNEAGGVITSLAPGEYTVVIQTPEAFGAVPLTSLGASGLQYCKGLAQFQLSGPGVSLSTSVYGGCLSNEQYNVTFQPNATYTAQDNNQPSVTRTVFNTLSAAFTVVPTTVTSGSSAGTSDTDIVGSAVALEGTLSASLSAKGISSLTLGGKTVSRLAVGRYKFAITDRDPKGSVIIVSPRKTATNLTGVRFVGKKTATVKLTAGRWTYSAGAKTFAFTVAG